MTLFKGEKTSVFWAGLLIMSLAAVVLFWVIWGMRSYSSLPYNLHDYVENSIPVIVGAIVFTLVGLYMMKSGVKKNQPL
jgi:hypothetical protein